MAEIEDINPRNVAGKFYNDITCIDCDLCREIAPSIFTRDDEAGLSYVHKQPEGDEEVSLAIEAMEGCPTESIGSDGIDDRQ